MPHIIIEYSANIAYKNNISQLLPIIHNMLVDKLSANINACKSRVLEYNNYLIADGDKNKSFIHITIKILAGRSDELKNNFGLLLQEKLRNYFKELHDINNLSLSIEIKELQNYFK